MKSLTSITFLYILCITLHVLLVAAHVILVIIWARHDEHNVIVPLDRGGTISTRIVVASQVFVIVYTAAILFLTQRLALNSMLLRRNTLTAAHDISSAWTGLGASLLSMWRQLFIPAAVLGTTGVTVYLTCMSILHISTPSLFSMEAYNQTGSISVALTSGMPQINDPELPGSTNPFDVWESVCSLLPYLVLVGPGSTLGLANNTLYDILDPNNGIGNVTVDAMTANVTCGTLPNATAVQQPNQYVWTVEAAYDEYNITFDLVGILESGVLRQYAWFDEPDNVTLLLGRYAMFVTTFDVVDSEGDVGSRISGYPYAGLQIIGCTLAWNPVTVTVDASTRFVVDLDLKNETSTWSVWTPEIQVDGQPRENSLTDSWADMLDSAGEASYMIGTTVPNGTGADYIYALQTEQYLMDMFDMPLSKDNITLNEFQDALGDMTAAVFWAGTHVLSNTARGNYLALVSGETAVSQTVSRLNLNLTPILFGLCSSVLLLLLAILFTHGVRANAGLQAIDGLGVLQFMWLVSDHKPLQTQVAQVDEPSTTNLRKAGMMEINGPKKVRSTTSFVDMTYTALEAKADE